MPGFDADATLAFLTELRAAPRAIAQWPAEHLPPDERSAYQIQERLIAQTGQKIVGWKVGLTSPAIRAQTGLSEPIYGPVLAPNRHETPYNAAAKSYGRLGIELEIALFLGADLPASGAPYDMASVAPAVEAAATSFELIDDRAADYTRLDARRLIVDGSWQAGVVLGKRIPMSQQPNLAAGTGVLVVDGKEIASAAANAGMGHCFNVLAWLANRLAKDGKPLTRGMLVMTGSIVAAYFPQTGQHVSGEIAGMGKVDLTVS